jgi:hypothetical protein
MTHRVNFKIGKKFPNKFGVSKPNDTTRRLMPNKVKSHSLLLLLFEVEEGELQSTWSRRKRAV